MRFSRLLVGFLTILLMVMVLLVPPPHVYADDDSGLPPAPALPSKIGKFPGYNPVKISVSVLPPSGFTGSVKSVCTIPSDDTGGIATVSGGQLIGDLYTGDLWFYNTAKKTCSIVQSPPSGANGGFWGLAAVKQGTTSYLVALDSYGGLAPGLWTCTFSTSTHLCTSVSSWITIPSSFCSTLISHVCYPYGMAFDKSRNLWYVDVVNEVEVELTKASHYTAVGPGEPYSLTCEGAGSGCKLVGIVIDSSGNHYWTDRSCLGEVYKNGALFFSAGDSLNGITISTSNPSKTAHLYVTLTNGCGHYPYPFVGDVNDLTILPSAYSSGADEMPAISTSLYFTDDSHDMVWHTYDAV